MPHSAGQLHVHVSDHGDFMTISLRTAIVPLMQAPGVALLLLLTGATPAFPELRQPPSSKVSTQKPMLPAGAELSWDQRRAELRGQWEQVLGPFPPRVPLETEIASTEALDDHTRILLRYRIDPRTRVEAYLL